MDAENEVRIKGFYEGAEKSGFKVKNPKTSSPNETAMMDGKRN